MVAARVLPVLLAVALAALAAAGLAAPVADGEPGADTPEGVRVALASPHPMPRTSARDTRRCTPDGARCISLATYVPDVCRLIDDLASENALDRNFFARLLWQESLFDAGAVSPAGAQGIAQFMPGTARLRGLDDPFNPAAALDASARYLAELARTFGNLGLAAVAYNGGEARAERFVARRGRLPRETRAYVVAITGESAETWRDAPPATLDLTLDDQAAFQPACIAMAANRGLRRFRAEPVLSPWGVVVASNRRRDGAERQVARLRNRHGGVLAGEQFSYSHTRPPGMRRALHFAQVGRNTRAEAEALCARLHAAGGDCMVLRNP